MKPIKKKHKSIYLLQYKGKTRLDYPRRWFSQNLGEKTVLIREAKADNVRFDTLVSRVVQMLDGKIINVVYPKGKNK